MEGRGREAGKGGREGSKGGGKARGLWASTLINWNQYKGEKQLIPSLHVAVIEAAKKCDYYLFPVHDDLRLR